MKTVAYPGWLRERIESEILGEALALALIEVAKSATPPNQWFVTSQPSSNG